MGAEIKFHDKGGNIRTLDEMVLFDTMTNAMVKISYTHHKIHDGCSFTVAYADTTLADGETIIMAFKTMSGTKKAHLFIEFSTLVGGYIEIWEAPTWTTNTGTATAIINRRRDANPKVSGLTEDKTATPAFTTTGNILVNPTGLAGGTSLHKHYAWGERGKVGAIGQRDENEFVLRPDTQYAIVFNGIGANNKAQVILNWYEHDG